MKKLLFMVLTLSIMLVGCSEVQSFKEVELKYKNLNHPVINNNYIYFSAANNSLNNESVDKLIKYDLKNTSEEIIYESEFEQSSMQQTKVNDDWLVWVDSTLDGMNAKILSMDLKTETIRELDTTNPEYLTILAPSLYDNYVGWISFENENEIQVKLHNLETNETKTIGYLNSFGLHNAFISIQDNIVVWTDTKDELGSYNLYDIKKKKVTTIPAPEKYPAYAKISDNKIFSINFPDFSVWGNQNFGYYDLKEEKYFELELDNMYINSFDVFDGQLIIIDHNQELKRYNIEDNKVVEIKEIVEEKPLQANFDQEGNIILLYEDSNEMKLKVLYSK